MGADGNFNPRSRVGNDNRYEYPVPVIPISIHVPAWGTTGLFMDYKKEIIISIHVPAWGTTEYHPETMFADIISIHVPAWGTTRVDWLLRHLRAFQSTFPRGERLQISTIFHLYICISSTNSHFSITSFCIFYLIHFFLICFFQLFMVRIFWGFSVYFWFALYRNNT